VDGEDVEVDAFAHAVVEAELFLMHRRRTSPHRCSSLSVRGERRGRGGEVGGPDALTSEGGREGGCASEARDGGSSRWRKHRGKEQEEWVAEGGREEAGERRGEGLYR
jgi:hypothetical protein